MFDDFWIGNCCDFEQVEEAKPCILLRLWIPSGAMSRHVRCQGMPVVMAHVMMLMPSRSIHEKLSYWHYSSYRDMMRDCYCSTAHGLDLKFPTPLYLGQPWLDILVLELSMEQCTNQLKFGCFDRHLRSNMIEGSLEVKLPTIWTDEKQSKAKRREKIRREKSRRERVRRKKMQMREKLGKSQHTVFFQWFVSPEGREVGSLKRRVRSQLARWEMKNCTPLWREADFQVKMYKTHHSRTTFGSWDVKKVHAVVARSTCRSQNVTKHTMLGPLLEVEMSKKCTPLWREAHFQVKM